MTGTPPSKTVPGVVRPFPGQTVGPNRNREWCVGPRPGGTSVCRWARSPAVRDGTGHYPPRESRDHQANIPSGDG